MKDIYVKKFSQDEGVYFFFHFQDSFIVRQIEKYPDKTCFIADNLGNGYLLPTVKLENIEDFRTEDYITDKEFEREWEKQEQPSNSI